MTYSRHAAYRARKRAQRLGYIAALRAPAIATPLDVDTAETLRNMVRYIADDDRIARHLAIDPYHVRRARAALPARHPMREARA